MPKRWDELIEKHAKRVGIDPAYMKRTMKIESYGDPNAKTGSYKGLFQLDDAEFRKHGGSGSVYDPEQNIMAAANMFAKQHASLKERLGRDPKPIDMYMVHQQGAAGYSAHLANPDKPAWENVRQYYKTDAIAKAAIWGNVPDKDKARFGSVENVTSGKFVNDVWARRMEGGEAEFGGTAMPGGSRGRARSEADPKMSFLEAQEEIRKKALLNQEFEPITPEFGNLVPKFSIGSRA
jgi:Transglycosylase SLT domain